MPWNETEPMKEGVCFVAKVEEGMVPSFFLMCVDTATPSATTLTSTTWGGGWFGRHSRKFMHHPGWEDKQGFPAQPRSSYFSFFPNLSV